MNQENESNDDDSEWSLGSDDFYSAQGKKLVSRSFRDAIYSQFTRLKEFRCTDYGEISFYEEENNSGALHTVPKRFVDVLLKRKQFRPSKMVFGYLCNSESSFNPLDGPTQQLRRIIGLPVEEEEQENVLSVERIAIKGTISARDRFTEFLNLDAKELKVSIDDSIAFAILPAPIGFTCSRTKNITIELNTLDHTSEFPVEDWISFLHHLLLACPKLEKLSIRLNMKRHYNDVNFMLATLDHMEVGVKALSEDVLLNMKRDSTAEIDVKLHCWINSDLTLPLTHPLFNLVNNAQEDPINMHDVSYVMSPMRNRTVRFTVSRGYFYQDICDGVDFT